MTRAYRYVVDHGELFRMTERRFAIYLLAATYSTPDASKYGVRLGLALTVNKLGAADYLEEFNKLHEHIRDDARAETLGRPRAARAKDKEP